MLRKALTMLVAGTLIHILCIGSAVSANPKTEKQRAAIEKVKAGILSLGTGPDTHVEVKLRDKTKLSGFISEANEESFVVSDAKTGAKTTVPYPDIAKVSGNNWSTKKTIAITALIVGTLAIIYFAIHGAGKRL